MNPENFAKFMKDKNLKDLMVWTATYARSPFKVKPEAKQIPVMIMVNHESGYMGDFLVCKKNNKDYKLKSKSKIFFTKREAQDYYNQRVEESINTIKSNIKQFEEDIVNLENEKILID